MNYPLQRFEERITRPALALVFVLVTTLFVSSSYGQNTVTGAFQGRVTDSITDNPIPGAAVTITNERTGTPYTLVTDGRGEFFQNLLAPGAYLIKIEVASHQPKQIRMPLNITRTGEVVPVPVTLDPIPPGGAAAPIGQAADAEDNIRVEINTTDARRDDSYSEKKIAVLPLGSQTITRTLDELALLSPGVTPPPQTIGDVAGPGVGPGVGSAGQFAVNGMRSRANNFTVDGSDNNDEDIGVRRQGFVALSSQPVESVQEFQIITLLAPAQFGRNIGAQVNIVSKTGGAKVNGSLYGYFNSDRLNARNYFDTIDVVEQFPFRSAPSQAVPLGQRVLLDGREILVGNNSGGESPFTAFQGGGTLGGPIIKERTFYFLSGEYQKINASQEKHFAVPTVDDRGLFDSGAKGIVGDPFSNTHTLPASPASLNGNAIFSLFPFPNNPTGVYGPNTFTQVLPAGGRGGILSGRLDHNFPLFGREHSITGRYNFTDDEKNIPAINDALFATVLAKTQTHNLSVFLNSQLSPADSDSRLFNQVRFSFGRTRLNFDEVRDKKFLVPSSGFRDTPFLLNAPYLFNTTFPQNGQANTGDVTYVTRADAPTVEDGGVVDEGGDRVIGGPLGQVVVSGFSPLGVDVYNFPQTRVNKTYQIADELSWQTGGHNLVFGLDTRRTDLNSDLPRLSRPLITFNGAPRVRPSLDPCPNGGIVGGPVNFCYLAVNDRNRAIRPEDLLALGVASSSLLTFNVDRPGAQANLRYYQLNFYGQDTWRVYQNLSFSFGLRYEYNTPVKEVDNLIEQTFSDQRLDFAEGLKTFIDRRTRLYEPDLNNFAPRLGIAFSPSLFGNDRVSVFRVGYGIFYDQILGAVVNQSRNVFPSFLTLNLGGIEGGSEQDPQVLTFYNPVSTSYGTRPYAATGTINMFNSAIPLEAFLNDIGSTYPNAISSTLPARQLDTPLAQHYSIFYEQQLSQNLTASVGYVGTSGRSLLRFTTPNLGAGAVAIPVLLNLERVDSQVFPLASGIIKDLGRPENSIGAVNIFETTAASDYNSLQTELRGRFASRFNFLLSYVFSKVEDDVSDVFDLAGAYALPQDSLTFAGERGPANFDVRHRFTYQAIYNFGSSEAGGSSRWLTDNLQIAGTGRFHTGQPFTVNSIVDVNLDGNLTDRLNTTDGIEITGDRQAPLRLITDNPFSLLAPFGLPGSVGRNTFRAGNVLELDLSVIKPISFGNQRLLLRADIFNFINRANFGIPVRLLEAPGFGRATSTVTPGRRIQFSLKYQF